MPSRTRRLGDKVCEPNKEENLESSAANGPLIRPTTVQKDIKVRSSEQHSPTTGCSMSKKSKTTVKEKSAYEMAREERLRQNRQRMMELGLNQTASDLAVTIQAAVRDEMKTNALVRKPVANRKKTRPESMRRSKRTRGLGPEENGGRDNEAPEDKEKLAKLRKLVEVYGRW